jgi:hypothetical protein
MIAGALACIAVVAAFAVPSTLRSAAAQAQGRSEHTTAAHAEPGYWLFGADGGVFTFGTAKFLGSATNRCSHQCFGSAATPDGNGYWILDTLPPSGRLYGYGTAFDVANLPPISVDGSAVASDATGKGGWVLNGQDGTVTPFGDAISYGDPSGLHLHGQTIPGYGTFTYFQGMVGTPDGKGYWIVGIDGGVFSFGDAGFYGSMGGKPLNAPAVGVTRTNDGRGYWLVALDGGVFSFGDAGFYGSMGGKPLNDAMIAIAANPDGTGYWTAALDGGVFSFGDAPFLGSLGGVRLNGSIHGIAATK